MAHNKNINSFSRTDISDAIRIWERAAISLLDIRHSLISADEAVRNYRLPANTFIYTSGAGAEILLNDQSFRVNRFGVFHAGKGTTLSILPADSWLEYYMLLYKAQESPFQKKEFARLLERTNPFRQQYGFAPNNPLFFGHQLRLMYEKWKGPTPLNLFYGKAAFYQLVYEVYEELEKGRIQVFEPDLVSMASRYMDQHYRNAITIQEICDMLSISYSHFHRRFTKQLGKSPQEYLIQTRLAAAIECLNNSEASIREVAEYCGFQDERNFHRLFVKNMGMAPIQYKENVSDNRRDYTIGNILPFPYNGESRVSLDELKEKGALSMFKQMRSKAVVAAALSLILLMSACSTAPTNKDVSTPTSAVSSQVEKESVAPVDEETRTITTVMGDVEVPMNPKNVLINFHTGDVLAFGITPVAIDKDSVLSYTPFADVVQDIPQVSFWSSPEELVEWQPDVIILAAAGGEGYYEKASKIAPVIVCPSDMNERITLLGKVFGMEEKAEQLLQEYASKVESTKEKIKNLGFEDKTFSIVEATEDSGATVRFFYDDNGRGGEIIYKDLGLKAPEKLVKEYPDFSMTVSMEVVSEYVGDFVFYNRATDDFDYSNMEIWNSLPAVKNGNVIEIDGNLFYHHDIISTNNQLEAIEEALLNLSAQ